MNDWGKSVLNQYGMLFENVRRGKGVLICTANQREYCLMPFRGSEKRLTEEAALLELLTEKGHLVDRMIQTEEGTYIARNEYQDPFILRRWHSGEECVSTDAEQLLRGVRKLARLHLDMRHVPELTATPDEKESRAEQSADEAADETFHEQESTDVDRDVSPAKNPEETRHIDSCMELFLRHSRELKKIGVYVKKRKQKTSFEELVERSLPAHIEQAREAQELLERSGYQKLLDRAVEERCFIHGAYNYHYIYLQKEGEAVVNFSKYGIQVQILDLYEFLRKSLEKNSWDQQLGDRLLRAYAELKPITDQELLVLKACLLYPEKYWKQLNIYYNSNKAWIPLRSQEKLTQAVEQSALREKFVKNLSIFGK
jgi:spore coat protein I